MRLIFECPNCKKKNVEVKSEKKLGQYLFKTLSCAHVITEKLLGARPVETVLNDGRELYPFQIKGAEFARDSGFRCLIADEMGLGKTIQAVALLKSFPELRPALVVVKASLTVNWLREIFNGAGLISQVLDSKSTPVVGNGKIKIDCYIASYDSLRNAKWKDMLKPNFLILDEVQMIKNHDSKRTQAVRDIARDVKHVLELSGTPIKNNAAEYFPALNVLRSDLYRNQNEFIRLKTNAYWDGYRYRIGGLKYPERFAEETKDFIIRRTRKEVLPDLPSARVSFRYTTMVDEIKKSYDHEVDEFSDYMDNNQSENGEENITNILAYMNRMRHIVGLAKTQDVLEYVNEFLEDREGQEKLTIFHHHHDVGNTIQAGAQVLLGAKEQSEVALQLKSEMDSGQRQVIIDKFKDDPKARILIAPTLACGEGINLQFCSTVILSEREWNPANEEQAAPGRFSRIGSVAQFIDVVMPVAINSIDELFAEYVERKRQYMKETLEGKTLDISQRWSQSQVLKEIAEKLAEQNRKSWRVRVGV